MMASTGKRDRKREGTQVRQCSRPNGNGDRLAGGHAATARPGTPSGGPHAVGKVTRDVVVTGIKRAQVERDGNRAEGCKFLSRVMGVVKGWGAAIALLAGRDQRLQKTNHL
jgi:hypothetical protein